MFDGFYTFFHDTYLITFPKRFLIALSFLLLYSILVRLKPVRGILHRLRRINDKHFLVTLIFLSIFIRAIWCCASPTVFSHDYADTRTKHTESSLINIYAVQISQTGIPRGSEGGTLSLHRPIGYPYLLGGIYRLIGYHDGVFLVVQILLGVGLIPLAFILGMSIFRKRSVAWIAALLMAVYPLNIFSTNIILDEFPFFFTLFLIFCDVADNINKKSAAHTFRIAILLGLCTAFRTHALLLPVIFFLNYLLNGIPWKKALVQMLVCFAAIYAVSGPWAWLTYKAYGQPCFFTTAGSVGFYGTLNDRAFWHNGYLPRTVEEGGVPEFFNEKNPVKIAAVAKKLAVQWVCRNPVKTLKLILMRNAALFGFQLDDIILDVETSHATSSRSFAVKHLHSLRKITSHAYSLIFIFGVLGSAALIFSKKHFFLDRYPAFSLLLSFFIYWFILHGLFFGFRKYRWLCDLFLFFPAAYLLEILRARSGAPVPDAAASKTGGSSGRS